MDSKQFRGRIGGIIALFLLIVGLYMGVLYDLQIVQGAAYLEQSQRKIAKVETVDAARGEILDRYGRLLVSNRTGYNVSLDTSHMGEDAHQILLNLLDICRDQEVAWADTLPLTVEEPYRLTLDESTSGAQRNYQNFVEREKLGEISGGESLLAALRTHYEVDEALSDEVARGLVGVLYELTLRSREITYVSYVFAQDVDIQFITTVKERGLSGVRIDPTTVRQYHTSYAAHILGRIGPMNGDEWNNIYSNLDYAYDAVVGKEGVEQAFETYLHGQSGVRTVETNTAGKIVSETWLPDEEGNPQVPQPGGNVMLTLDIELQGMVEQSLADRVAQLASEDTQGAAAVVVDVDDGGVLAMASYPTYDINTYLSNWNELAQDPLNPLFNRATQGIYPPGSTYKMVTTIGGLEEDILDIDSTYYCGGRYQYYSDYQPQCWIFRQYGGTHGAESISDAIRDSCNIFMYDTGRRLGIDKLEEYARKFGLGEPTGIELYEKTGTVAGPAYTESLGQVWNTGSTLAAAIGQENNQFTPLQLANYTATLANGGSRYSAHLLKEVKSNDYSQILMEHQPEVVVDLGLVPEELAEVTQGMLEVTQPGGSAAGYFAGLDVDVAAKTGSAQVSGSAQSNAVFVCYAPYDDPEIAIAIVVERGGSGSTLSNIAVDILDYYFSTGNNMESVEQENQLLR